MNVLLTSIIGNENVTVTQNEDGSYKASFTPNGSGPFQLSVSHGNRPFNGSPFTLQVKATIDSTKTSLTGPNEVIDGNTVELSIQAQDKRGQFVAGQSDSFSIQITDSVGPVPFTIKENSGKNI